MSKAKVSDLRRYYPDMESADRDYPPLKFKSLKGKVSAAEWQARVDCACAYRLVRHYGMDDLIYNHISARIAGTEEFLLNPFGLLYEEICASALIKVNLKGDVLWQPDWPKGLDYTFNLAGFVIHGAIHPHAFAGHHGGVVAEEGAAADDADRDALRKSRLPRLRRGGDRDG